jgi:hypothetical protein
MDMDVIARLVEYNNGEIWNNILSFVGAEQMFIDSCENGQLETAKFIYSKCDEVHAFNLVTAFNKCCKKGHIDIAQWLYSFDIEGYRTDVDLAPLFRIACEEGYFELAKWLYSLKKKDNKELDIYEIDAEFAFGHSRFAEHLDVAKWIHSLIFAEGQRANANSVEIFCQYCIKGNTDVAQWLYSMDIKKYRTDVDLTPLFCEVCENGHFESAKWLY